LVDTLSLIF